MDARLGATPRPRQAGQGSDTRAPAPSQAGHETPSREASLQTVPSPPQCEHALGSAPVRRAGRAARFARGQPIDGDVRLDPGHRLLERELDRDVDVVAPAAAGVSTARGDPRTAARPAALAVVDGPRGRIAQDAVGLGDLLEQRVRVALPEVHVGRIAARQAADRRGGSAPPSRRPPPRVPRSSRAWSCAGPTRSRGPRAPPAPPGPAPASTSSLPDPRTRRPPRRPSARRRRRRLRARARPRLPAGSWPGPRGTSPRPACATPGSAPPAPS